MGTTSEENNHIDSPIRDMDSPPILYIAKYNRLIDTGQITICDDAKYTSNDISPLPSSNNEYR